MQKMRIAVPGKGRMAQSILELLQDAGLGVRDMQHDRGLMASLGEDFDALFVRAEDIPELVADKVVDVGVTGWDLICESEHTLDVLLDLELGKCRLIAAAPEKSDVMSAQGLPDNARVATSFPRLATRFFAEQGKPITVVPVSGAAEVAPQLGIADAIVDLTSTGSTLRVNGLRELEVILESTARLVAPSNRTADRRLDELTVALQSVLHAKKRRYVMANIPKATVDTISSVLPGLNGPTVTNILGNDERVAVHAVVDTEQVYRTIAALKALGAQGILVTRIERLMP